MTEVAPKPLRSFYGASDRLKNRTRTLIGSPDTERPQEIFTPEILLDAIDLVWPEGIALDPCPHPDSPVFNRAKSFYCEGVECGLSHPWEPFTYANPPFKYLKDWLAKALDEYVSGTREMMLLVPVRTHRKWFRAACLLADDTCWLDPVTFEGYPTSFPAPLCMLYYGERKDRFREVFNALGDCACLS
jgi:hypothetical protein